MSFNISALIAGIQIMATFNVYCWDDGNEDKPEVYPINAATAEEAERQSLNIMKPTRRKGGGPSPY